jgi:hypothetical protein
LPSVECNIAQPTPTTIAPAATISTKRLFSSQKSS